jgi:thymidylate synthase
MIIYQTIHDAYLGSIEEVLDNPDYICAPRGLEIYEKVDFSFRVLNPVAEPIVTKDEERNKVIAEYTKKEMDWYMSLDNTVEAAAKCSKFWEKIGNPDGTVNSNYGYLVFGLCDHGNPSFEDKMRTPWQWAVDALKKDKDTRQAIVRFSRPEHFYSGVKDFTCTTHGIFQIRENKLNFSIVMRANDVTLGIVYDICFFVSLMDKMVEELKPYYPNLQKGHYTHMAHSYHAYVKDLPRINKMLGRE